MCENSFRVKDDFGLVTLEQQEKRTRLIRMDKDCFSAVCLLIVGNAIVLDLSGWRLKVFEQNQTVYCIVRSPRGLEKVVVAQNSMDKSDVNEAIQYCIAYVAKYKSNEK
jgi:hypothetical protein